MELKLLLLLWTAPSVTVSWSLGQSFGDFMKKKNNNHKNCLWQASGRRQLSASCYVWLSPACKSWQDHRVNKANQRWNCIFCLDEWPAEGAGTLIVSFPWAEKGRFGRRSGRALLCPTFLVCFFFLSFLFFSGFQSKTAELGQRRQVPAICNNMTVEVGNVSHSHTPTTSVWSQGC